MKAVYIASVICLAIGVNAIIKPCGRKVCAAIQPVVQPVIQPVVQQPCPQPVVMPPETITQLQQVVVTVTETSSIYMTMTQLQTSTETINIPTTVTETLISTQSFTETMQITQIMTMTEQAAPAQAEKQLVTVTVSQPAACPSTCCPCIDNKNTNLNQNTVIVAVCGEGKKKERQCDTQGVCVDIVPQTTTGQTGTGQKLPQFFLLQQGAFKPLSTTEVSKIDGLKEAIQSNQAPPELKSAFTPAEQQELQRQQAVVRQQEQHVRENQQRQQELERLQATPSVPVTLSVEQFTVAPTPSKVEDFFFTDLPVVTIRSSP